MLLTAAVVAIFGERAYLWIKAVHVIAIISWMAGMLYLPRLFIYHCDAEKGSVQSETFKVMEQRLLTIIMNPAMVIAWALGMWLAWTGGFLSARGFTPNWRWRSGFRAAHGYFSAVRAGLCARTATPSRPVIGGSSTKSRQF